MALRRSGNGEINPMAPADLIVDASVVIKWFNIEPDREKALEVRAAHLSGEIRLIAPALLPYEVCNALKHSPSYDELSLIRALDALHKIGLTYKSPDADQMTQTTKLAYRYGLTAYDSSYLACAEVADTSLVTADKRLYDKAMESKRVMLLSGYGKVA